VALLASAPMRPDRVGGDANTAIPKRFDRPRDY
jgi:hypothetical protein